MPRDVARLLAASAIAALALAAPRAACAQGAPVTRRAAVDSALHRAPRLAAAQATLDVAKAEVLSARVLPNPTLSGEYSKAAPRLHALADVPFDLPGVRGRRTAAASAAYRAAGHRFRWDSAGIALDADTAYTMALAAAARAQLSRRNADDVDSLRQIAARRVTAGDAAEMDVLLATITSGQAENAAASDSLEAMARLLDLQAVMGLPTDAPRITLADSLAMPNDSLPLGGAPDGTPRLASSDGSAVALPDSFRTLSVAAAEADVAAAEQRLTLQRRLRWGQPSLTVGAEWRGADDEPGVLPIVGLAIPLPLFDRNRGPLAVARAERARTVAELSSARIQAQSDFAHATREYAVARLRARRDRTLLADAERVSAMSLTAYREGASTLAGVLEARRSVRDVTTQYVDDVAATLVAAARLRHITLAPSSR